MLSWDKAKRMWLFIEHSIFNVFVSNKGLKAATFNFFTVWRIDCWMQHSIFNLLYLKIWVLMTAFNFQFVHVNNIQFFTVLMCEPGLCSVGSSIFCTCTQHKKITHGPVYHALYTSEWQQNAESMWFAVKKSRHFLYSIYPQCIGTEKLNYFSHSISENWSVFNISCFQNGNPNN